ncbi:MAG: hypothetical protein JOZ75_12335 [Candidatus Dormibacteraeota bacterium]|nr:hypothetical protein [Candidatus Dormibacteraeota bacterium]
MTLIVKPGSDALQDIFWQDELTEAMSWLSEGREGEPIDAATIQRVLWPGATLDDARLQQMVDDGLVERVSPATFTLTERGRTRGRMLLEADNLETLQPSGVCNTPGCKCCADAGVDIA